MNVISSIVLINKNINGENYFFLKQAFAPVKCFNYFEKHAQCIKPKTFLSFEMS